MNEEARPRIPIACSLTADDLADRERAWRQLLDVSLVTRRRIPGGIALDLHPGSATALQQLVDLERACCPWITFDLREASVTMTAPGVGERMLDTMFR